MKNKRNLLLNISLALLVASACIHLSRTVFFWNLEFLSLDMLFHLRGAPATTARNPNIVVVEITDNDLYEFGRWPWPRNQSAELCSILEKLGPKEIFLDFLFNLPSIPREDDALGQAIQEAGNIYLPFALSKAGQSVKEPLYPLPQFLKGVKGSGATTLFPDKDGKWRRIPLFLEINGQRYNHIVLQMALDGLQMKVTKISPKELVLANAKDQISIPLVEGNKMLLNWQGKWAETFKRYSFSDVYHAYQDIQAQRVPHVDLSPFQNSICLVAVTATGFFDAKPNPLEPRYPGIGIMATALSNIYNRQFLYVLPLWFNLIFVYLFALVPPLYLSTEKSGREVLLALFLIGSVVWTNLLFLNGFVMNFSLPFIALIASYIAVSLFNSARAVIEKRVLLTLATTDGLTGLYNIRYFKEILNEEYAAVRKDPERQFCVILCDIDHFKQFNDNYGHQIGDFILENVARILKNSVRVLDVVARYGGDELVILMRHTSLKNACQVAEKMRANIENSELGQMGQLYKVTASIGVAHFNPKRDNPASILKKADEALYHAKQKGKNRVICANEKS